MHGNQDDPYNAFIDPRSPIDTPAGHHVVRQVLPQFDEVVKPGGLLDGLTWLAEPTHAGEMVGSRLLYRKVVGRVWWLGDPVLRRLRAPAHRLPPPCRARAGGQRRPLARGPGDRHDPHHGRGRRRGAGHDAARPPCLGRDRGRCASRARRSQRRAPRARRAPHRHRGVRRARVGAHPHPRALGGGRRLLRQLGLRRTGGGAAAGPLRAPPPVHGRAALLAGGAGRARGGRGPLGAGRHPAAGRVLPRTGRRQARHRHPDGSGGGRDPAGRRHVARRPQRARQLGAHAPRAALGRRAPDPRRAGEHRLRPDRPVAGAPPAHRGRHPAAVPAGRQRARRADRRGPDRPGPRRAAGLPTGVGHGRRAPRRHVVRHDLQGHRHRGGGAERPAGPVAPLRPEALPGPAARAPAVGGLGRGLRPRRRGGCRRPGGAVRPGGAAGDGWRPHWASASWCSSGGTRRARPGLRCRRTPTTPSRWPGAARSSSASGATPSTTSPSGTTRACCSPATASWPTRCSTARCWCRPTRSVRPRSATTCGPRPWITPTSTVGASPCWRPTPRGCRSTTPAGSRTCTSATRRSWSASSSRSRARR